MDSDRSNRRDPFGFYFEDIFAYMNELMNRSFRFPRLLPRFENLEKLQDGEPIVYGYSLRVGPDGIPHFKEWGNVKGLSRQISDGKTSGVREPLVDVIEEDKSLKIIAELPGVSKDKISVKVKPKSLKIKADTESKAYEKELELPTEVIPKSTKSLLKNGVLEVTLKKKTTDPAVDIKVE